MELGQPAVGQEPELMLLWKWVPAEVQRSVPGQSVQAVLREQEQAERHFAER
jgi:hypothetical protein